MSTGGTNHPRVVVVTGASAGLGRAVALAFAERGARVALMSRDEGRLARAVGDVNAHGGTGLALPVDVADFEGVCEAAGRVEAELGQIDVWVNNAMSSVFAPFEEILMEDFARALQVTFMGFVHGTRAALGAMQPRDHGVIVQVSSALAYRGIPLQSPYCAAKHAIVGFTESLRTELMHRGSGIAVTMVHMPAMNTPQFDWVRSRLSGRAQPVPPIYQPEVGARAVVHAADHPRRRSYCVGLSTTLTVLGNKIAPGLLDRYLARTGFDSQQTDEPEDPGRPDNLYKSVEGPYDSHGRFDQKAHARSPWSAMTRHLPPW